MVKLQIATPEMLELGLYVAGPNNTQEAPAARVVLHGVPPVVGNPSGIAISETVIAIESVLVLVMLTVIALYTLPATTLSGRFSVLTVNQAAKARDGEKRTTNKVRHQFFIYILLEIITDDKLSVLSSHFIF